MIHHSVGAIGMDNLLIEGDALEHLIPTHPPVPGSKPPENEMIIATSGTVKALITKPQSETVVKMGTSVC